MTQLVELDGGTSSRGNPLPDELGVLLIVEGRAQSSKVVVAHEHLVQWPSARQRDAQEDEPPFGSRHDGRGSATQFAFERSLVV